MRAEYLDDVLPPFSESDLGARDPLSHEPVSAEKGRGSAVQWVADHVALFDGPFGEDGEPAAKDAAVIEFAVGKGAFREFADLAVVFRRPAFLEADDVGDRAGGGEARANFGKAFAAIFGYVF